jgi:hypothetical protein
MAGPPPLRAGPTYVQGPDPARTAGRRGDEEIRLAILAGLTLRYLGWDGDWPR